MAFFGRNSPKRRKMAKFRATQYREAAARLKRVTTRKWAAWKWETRYRQTPQADARNSNRRRDDAAPSKFFLSLDLLFPFPFSFFSVSISLSHFLALSLPLRPAVSPEQQPSYRLHGGYEVHLELQLKLRLKSQWRFLVGSKSRAFAGAESYAYRALGAPRR